MKYLLVNLQERTVTDIVIDEGWRRRYLGGRGLANLLVAKYERLYSGSEVLVFSCGILNGSGLPASGRWAVCGRSPVTGYISAGNAGGLFGSRLAWCGYMGIVIVGSSDEWTKLVITKDDVSIESALDMVGEDTSAVVDLQGKIYGGSITSAACIGLAGENACPIANIISDKVSAAGRGGLGCIMGRMHLKAIVVCAAETDEAKDNRLGAKSRAFCDSMKEEPYYITHSKWSTMNSVVNYIKKGAAMGKNGTCGDMTGYDEELNGQNFYDHYLTKTFACYSCPMTCRNMYETRDGTVNGGAQASVVKEFGARVGIKSLDTALKGHTLANQYGLDEISLGGVLSFAMECKEKGLIDGPGFGDEEGMLELIHKIAAREGLGDILASGTRDAARAIGQGSEEYALHVKGLELPATDPRGIFSWGLGYAVSSRGACHMRFYGFAELSKVLSKEEMIEIAGTDQIEKNQTWEGRGREVAYYEDLRAITDALGLCKFIYRDIRAIPKVQNYWLRQAGFDISDEELVKIGNRISNFERYMNVRAGLTPEDDTLPKRFTGQPFSEGPIVGVTVPIQRMVQDYYDARQWDKVTGMPTVEQIEDLEFDCDGL